jgi:DNA-directed RNA polymerase specialized sigma24 family protein
MMDMDNIEDIRIAVRLFLDAFKRHHTRSLTSSTALELVMRLSPNERAALTKEQLAPEIERLRQKAELVVEQCSAQLEQVLATDKNFLPVLQMYASQRLRD